MYDVLRELWVGTWMSRALEGGKTLGCSTSSCRTSKMQKPVPSGQVGARRMSSAEDHNRIAWNRMTQEGSPYGRPVSPEDVAAARRGQWRISITETEPVPSPWLPDVAGLDILCLASGGGQQGPILAAAGAVVTVLDLSDEQLARDQSVAEREGLEFQVVQGDMTDLSMFADASFDVIVHPVSNLFIPDVAPVWREAHRVLRPGGVLLSGFLNPIVYIFDRRQIDLTGELVVRYTVPYADEEQLPEEQLEAYRREAIPLEYGHSLTALIGGQIMAGFVISGFYEDCYDPATNEPISRHHPTMVATRAIKPFAG